jgi:hypothetical protein
MAVILEDPKPMHPEVSVRKLKEPVMRRLPNGAFVDMTRPPDIVSDTADSKLTALWPKGEGRP